MLAVDADVVDENIAGRAGSALAVALIIGEAVGSALDALAR